MCHRVENHSFRRYYKKDDCQKKKKKKGNRKEIMKKLSNKLSRMLESEFLPRDNRDQAVV